MIKYLGIAAIASIGLSACSTGDPDADCAIGTAGGAAIGGIIGDQIGGGSGNKIATAAGATAGGVYGSRKTCN